MRTPSLFAAVLVLVPSLALAQRLPFERTFEVGAGAVLDVTTERGKIDVIAGEPGRVVVHGVVAVRVAVDVPADALELAKKLAAAPPVAQEGTTIRLRPPGHATERRAVTISYQVRVPPGTDVRTDSDSGATSVSGINGSVSVKTQSAAIALASLGGPVDVRTGSGGVTVDGSAGDLTVETGSSSMKLAGLRGGLKITTQSGRIQAEGAPGKPWTTRTGSSSAEFSLASNARFSIDASSHSGDVTVEGAPVEGTRTKHKVAGSVRGGGPLIQATSQSGAIRFRIAR